MPSVNFQKSVYTSTALRSRNRTLTAPRSMPPVISTSWHSTADRFLVFELYISRITYSFGSDSFYSMLGWRMIHLCYYISSFCVDFHCDNMRQFTSLSVKDQHLGTFCCCYCSVAKSRPTLCDPMDCSITAFLVFHHLLEFAQTHVHWVDDAIQPSHPLPSPSPPAPNPSQHQSLFQWVNASHEVAKLLEFQLQHHSFQWIFRTDFL